MPLRDHFHLPLRGLCTWESFHSGWANGISFDASLNLEKSIDINSGTSSVATSSYRANQYTDPNNPGAATSNYQVDRIAKLTLAYNHKFFGDNRTSFLLYTQFRTGQRYSFTFQEPITDRAIPRPAPQQLLHLGQDLRQRQLATPFFPRHCRRRNTRNA